ncbi:hypothetical protein BD779DRAFT_1516138 [Infundibulicybe gibba]|nr:hypothetical protein BD779DRAFT_1516138 [Infundibulicybe gibba]
MTTILKAFNNTTAINDAFKWTRTEIIAFFEKVSKEMDTYDVEAGSRTTFATAVATVKSMTNTIFLDKAIAVKYQTHDFKLECLYDIVGWIFSVVGASPTSATKANYYYPLLALYCIICRRLINNTGKEPHMAQLTYFKQTVGTVVKWRVVLGTVLDRPKLARKEVARKNRFALLQTASLVQATEIDTSNVLQPNGAEAQKFGHCAETFPFLWYTAVKAQVDKPGVSGFSFLFTQAIAAEVGAEAQYKAPAGQVLQDPCLNCQTLIGRMGLTLANFLV